jgi:hypothetical protein
MKQFQYWTVRKCVIYSGLVVKLKEVTMGWTFSSEGRAKQYMILLGKPLGKRSQKRWKEIVRVNWKWMEFTKDCGQRWGVMYWRCVNFAVYHQNRVGICIKREHVKCGNINEQVCISLNGLDAVLKHWSCFMCSRASVSKQSKPPHNIFSPELAVYNLWPPQTLGEAMTNFQYVTRLNTTGLLFNQSTQQMPCPIWQKQWVYVRSFDKDQGDSMLTHFVVCRLCIKTARGCT